MKMLSDISGVVALMFLALGVFELWRFGITDTGALLFFAASLCGLSVALTVWVFGLRGRIAALEKQVQAQR
jgi:hypothetical protein